MPFLFPGLLSERFGRISEALSAFRTAAQLSRVPEQSVAGRLVLEGQARCLAALGEQTSALPLLESCLPQPLQELYSECTQAPVVVDAAQILSTVQTILSDESVSSQGPPCSPEQFQKLYDLAHVQVRQTGRALSLLLCILRQTQTSPAELSALRHRTLISLAAV